MTPFFFAFTFLNVWCVSLFASLALARGKGWKRLIIINTFLALGITGAIHLLLQSGTIPLREVLQ